MGKKKKEKIVIEKTENAQRPMKNVEFVKRKKKKTVIKVKRKGVEKKLTRNAVNEKNVSVKNVKKKKNAKSRRRSRKSQWKLSLVHTMKKVPMIAQWNMMLKRNPRKPTKNQKK